MGKVLNLVFSPDADVSAGDRELTAKEIADLSSDGPCCEAKRRFRCTRSEHPGQRHIATTDTRVLETW